MKLAPVKTYRSGAFARGLQELCDWIPNHAAGVEVGSFAGESAAIFASSGRLASLTCLDLWKDEYALAEPHFDQVAARFPDVIRKRKGRAADYAPHVPTQSLDFCYVDADHAYDKVRADLLTWRPKVRAGGLLAGHDYLWKFSGVQRAVFETVGIPERVFPDTSWVYPVPADNFQIITYCSRNFVDCLRHTLPTWLERAGADSIVVYTDCPDLTTLYPELKTAAGVQVRRIHEKLSADPVTSWDRKIDVLRDAFPKCLTEFFLWLDTDCLVTAPIRPLFDCLAGAEVAAGRLIGRTLRGRGQANAGVIAFRHDPTLANFFNDWPTRAAGLKAQHQKWYEQTALSHLVAEAFDGLHPYRGAVFSEKLWNCEEDNDKAWLDDIRKHHPPIIHFKAGRWARSDLRAAVAGALTAP